LNFTTAGLPEKTALKGMCCLIPRMAKFRNLWETQAMGNKDAPKREKKKPKKKKV